MSKDSLKSVKAKRLSTNKAKLPHFIDKKNNQVLVVEGTNVVRVPFGLRFARKKRPLKNQNIATLILPITSLNSPTPPPNVA